jgi:AcrR family transcriptional regulator
MAERPTNAGLIPTTVNGTTAERIWTVAAQLFREKGYHATTTRELAERLEITRASLYYYVSKKEDLLYGICMEALHRVSEAVQAAIAVETDPRDRIRALVHTQLTSSLTDIDLHATMLLNLHQLTGAQLAEVIEVRNAYESVVGSVIREAQAVQALRDDIAVRDLILVLLNMLNWTLTWYRPGGHLQPEEFARVISEVYLNGATTQ